MTIDLRKVRRGPHLPTLVASSITREIAQGRLKPGDQLPTEQMLASTFGVSRNVVREAIARLSSEGRIRSQQGRGAFVAESAQSTILKIEHDLDRPADAFIALFQFRGILEVQSAALAAKHRDQADLQRMQAALEAMENALYGSIDWLTADLVFHSAIALATGNTYVVQVLAFVSKRVRESILAAGNQHSDDMAERTKDEHRLILEAIRRQDEAGAATAMRDHLINAQMRTNIQSPGSAPMTVGALPVAQQNGIIEKKPRTKRRAAGLDRTMTE